MDDNQRLKQIIRELNRAREEYLQQLIEVDESDCQEETHEKDWLRKNKWKQPWNKK